MTEMLLKWVLSSSVLIAVVMALRQAFGKRISARLRYALWLAALVRLLIPTPLYTAPADTPLLLPETAVLQTLPTVWTPPETGNLEAVQPSEGPAVPAEPPSGEKTAPLPRQSVDWMALAGGVWLAGGLAVLLILLASNIGYGFRLRRARVWLAVEGPVPVFLLPGEGHAACLFGVLRPAVYVSPDTAADSVMLRHVLTHEFTHYRHGDHLWSMLRCLALAVHWWNPLVWLAAELSRRDAELACDEGALKRLGNSERRAYGATLLALVTAKPGPGDLLRCATTMSGGKRSLRERIERIAHVRKRWLWAAVLTAALAVLVCACSFAKPTEDPPDGPLTQGELDVFNNEVFNGDGFNIRNQFLYLAAESPEDYKQIDLYRLFYNGTGKPMEVTEAERQAVIDADWNGEDPGIDLIKCPAREMDEILRENLGLSLEETEQRGLNRFTYLPDYDAYYSFHGDTNYPGETAFLAGERKNGNILLYYQSGFMAQGGGWPVKISEDGEIIPAEDYATACVTLEEQENGRYRFLSNVCCDLPATPTAYPDWEPERTVSLDSAEPWEMEPVPIKPFSGQIRNFLKTELVNLPYMAEFWRGEDGYTYGSVQPGYSDSSPRDYFLRFEYDASEEQISAVRYTNVCGFNGFKVRYPIAMGTYLTDYYYFDEDKNLHRLVCDSGLFTEFDLDGDGQKELIWSPVGYGDEYLYLLYQHDGQLYMTELKSLIRSAWPEAGYINGYAFGSGNQRCIKLSVEVPVSNAEDFTVSAYRSICFDGENLRIYKDETPYTDHVKDSVDAPADIKASARRFVEGQFNALNEEGFGVASDGTVQEGVMVWDDWRIIDLQGPYYETVEGEQIEIWNLSYETHTPTPERMVLAGGSYLGEDGWAMFGYPGCDYLCFRTDEDGYRSLMFIMMENDCSPGSEMFHDDLTRQMKENDLLREQLSSSQPPSGEQ